MKKKHHKKTQDKITVSGTMTLYFDHGELVKIVVYDRKQRGKIETSGPLF